MADAFLRIPPFPGNRAQPLAVAREASIDQATALELTRLLRENRVGGNFWGSWPKLPEGRDLLLAPCSRHQAIEMIEAATAEGLADRCVMIDFNDSATLSSGMSWLRGTFDWWHIAEAPSQIWVDANHELALVAALAQRHVRLFGKGKFREVADEQGLVRTIQRVMEGWTYLCPFRGEAITPFQAIELLSEWRTLIDRNRVVSAFFGVASWKRPTVDPMLWDGTAAPRHATNISAAWSEGSYVVAWKSRTDADVLDRLLEVGLPVAEIEDGMIRGRGLGANCVPPLSVVVDFSGIYFDPSQPSDLERILESADIDGALLDRAARLRRMIVEAGISKYGGGSLPQLKSGNGRRVLIVGQVEDDRSVLSGGAGQTNLDLLKRARAIEPDAWLIYRPHPDVEAGHRKGHIQDQQVLQLADEIERGGSISALIEAVDEIHCITSLAGFEALLRGKKVTAHGAPFYAGWGLTTDLGAIPSRRNRRRSLDELVAAALIIYPTYLDPVTRLPCPPEILVERISRGQDAVSAPLAGLRVLQGKLKVALRRLAGGGSVRDSSGDAPFLSFSSGTSRPLLPAPGSKAEGARPWHSPHKSFWR